MQCPVPGLEPGLLNLETSVLEITMRPPCHPLASTVQHRVRTGHGKPGKSWNLGVSISRPGGSWNLIVGP